MFYVIGRYSGIVYGPFGTAREARAFRLNRPNGLGSSKRYYRVVLANLDTPPVSPALYRA